MEIAVLLATFNRKYKTLSCLESLFKQKMDSNINLQVYLTDDNSSDGTAIEVKKSYPKVNVLNGNGNLFWAGGMRSSWSAALQTRPDYYLLLNDDTVLKDNCISTLLSYYTLNDSTPNAIVVGSTLDETKNQISYGGHRLLNQKKVPCYNIFSETEFLDCDMANANIMLVPTLITDKIGILSENFTHSIADFDYTLRAKKAGFKVVVAPGALGTCVDDNLNDKTDLKRTLKQRIAHLRSPKGLAYAEYMGLIETHFPTHKVAVFFKIWAKTLFPGLWQLLKR